MATHTVRLLARSRCAKRPSSRCIRIRHTPFATYSFELCDATQRRDVVGSAPSLCRESPVPWAPLAAGALDWGLVQRRGGEAALVAAARRFKAQLWAALPTLWELVAAPLAVTPPEGAEEEGAAAAVAAAAALRALRVLSPALARELAGSVRPLVQHVARWAAWGGARARGGAVRAAAALARCHTEALMPELLAQVGSWKEYAMSSVP